MSQKRLNIPPSENKYPDISENSYAKKVLEEK